MKNVAVVFAGGVGARMGSETPKQFMEWNGKAVIIHTLEVFEKAEDIDYIILACKQDWISYTEDLIKKAGIKKVIRIVSGGETALDSQYNGIRMAKTLFQHEPICVLIHDGVRPLVSLDTIRKCVQKVKEVGNAITVTPAIETVITIDNNGDVDKILERSSCRMAKAPQCFLLDDILAAHERAKQDGTHRNFIDSSSMMIHYGHELHTVIGEEENIKITTPSDYYMFLGISRAREE